VREKIGTARAPRWRIEFFADGHGPLIADDDTTFVREDACIPPSAGEDLDIIDIGPADPSVKPITAPASAHHQQLRPETAVSNGSVPVASPTAETGHRQIGPYSYVPDESVDVDPAQWTCPSDSPDPNSTHSATITGADFTSIALLDETAAQSRATPIVWAAVTIEVRRGHIAALKAFRSYVTALGPSAGSIPIDVLLIHHLQRQRQEKSWAWSTLSRHAASLVGAFVSLPLYSQNSRSFNPVSWSHFRALLQTAKRLTVAHGQREPVECTANDVAAAITAAKTARARALLVLCWTTAQRPCDVIQMRSKDLEFGDDGKVRLRIVRGKTVGSQGPHYIHSAVYDSTMMSVLRDYVDGIQGPFLFPIGTAYHRTILMSELRQALRAARPCLEARSLRRGTLCCMALAGASERELLYWSRHTTPEALCRYLGFERTPHAEHQSMQARAATALIPTATGASPAATARRPASSGAAASSDPLPTPAHTTAGTAGTTTSTTRKPASNHNILPSASPRVVGGGALPHVVTIDEILDVVDGVPVYSIARAPKAPPDPHVGDDWPLHVKPAAVNAISIPKVDGLTVKPDVRAAWCEDRETLFNNDGRYDKVPYNGVLEEADLSDSDVAKLTAAGLIAHVGPEDMHRIRGTVIMFTRKEPAKQRRRRITWTKAFNDTYSTADVAPERGNATRDSAREGVIEAEGGFVLDMQAFFDFIPLSEEVTWFEVFTVRGSVYRNLRAAMGKRSSTSVATSLMKMLLSFERDPSVRVDFATDGVRFAGPKEACVAAGCEFVRRAAHVGARINEIDIDNWSPADIAALWRSTDVDFMGDVTDFTAKLIRCRSRHVDRLRGFVAQAQRADAAFSDLFRWWCMILYMADALGIPRDRYYATRTFFSTTSRRLAYNPSLWNQRCDTRPPPEIFHATAICLANRPARIVAAPIIDTVSIVDSCSLGYAGITCHRDSFGVFHTTLLQRRWDPPTLRAYDMSRSTNSEPEGLARTAEAVRRALDPSGHLMLSDHEAFVHAVSRRVSPSPFYNSRLQRLRYAGVDAVIYTPGDGMLADAYSRFDLTALTAADRAAAEATARCFFGRVVGKAGFRIVGG
jgi:integrase